MATCGQKQAGCVEMQQKNERDLGSWYASLFKDDGRKSAATSEVETRPKKRRTKRSEVDNAVLPVVSASASFKAKGHRPTLEDAEVCIEDLEATWKQGLSGAAFDPSNLKGEQRKLAGQFRKMQARLNNGKEGETRCKISLYGILDGHGGSEVAEFCAKWFPMVLFHGLASSTNDSGSVFSNTFQLKSSIIKSVLHDSVCELDSLVLSSPELRPDACGSTLAAVLILSTSSAVYSVSVGDSRIMLCQKGESGNLVSVWVTGNEHRPTNAEEHSRVLASGGEFIDNRLGGSLSITRAIGDGRFKKNTNKTAGCKNSGLIATPEVMAFRFTAETMFLVAACDGLWDVFTREAVAEFVNKRLSSDDLAYLDEDLPNMNDNNGSQLVYEYPCSIRNIDITARDMCKSAIYHRASFDNVSVVVLAFNSFGQPS